MDKMSWNHRLGNDYFCLEIWECHMKEKNLWAQLNGKSRRSLGGIGWERIKAFHVEKTETPVCLGNKTEIYCGWGAGGVGTNAFSLGQPSASISPLVHVSICPNICQCWLPQLALSWGTRPPPASGTLLHFSCNFGGFLGPSYTQEALSTGAYRAVIPHNYRDVLPMEPHSCGQWKWLLMRMKHLLVASYFFSSNMLSIVSWYSWGKYMGYELGKIWMALPSTKPWIGANLSLNYLLCVTFGQSVVRVMFSVYEALTNYWLHSSYLTKHKHY